MAISEELQSLSPTTLVELFVLDMTSIPGGSLVYFHAGTNELSQPVVWQGITYSPLPIDASGFDLTSKGALPRPIIRIANIDGLLSAQVVENDDLIGCKIIRKRTFSRYLDAINFAGGVNADANPGQHLPDDVWFVDRKTTENKYMIEWELASAFDLQGVMLPARQVIQNSCGWVYRSAECGWIGSSFDKNDIACSVADDQCSKRLSSCKKRFNSMGWDIPYGGFPGATQNV